VLRRVAVFASTTEVATPDEQATAQQVGRRLADRAVTLVVAAEATGPARTTAETALAAGGRVVGVGVGTVDEAGFTETRRVEDADQQRREMLMLADAVLALPGAFERLDEVLALWDAAVSGSSLPIGLLDEAGYYSTLLQRAGDEDLDRFVRESQRGMLALSRSLDDLLTRLDDFRPPETRR
jgi:predicted Rossmann-fold nucleotide-binding protein